MSKTHARADGRARTRPRTIRSDKFKLRVRRRHTNRVAANARKIYNGVFRARAVFSARRSTCRRPHMTRPLNSNKQN